MKTCITQYLGLPYTFVCNQLLKHHYQIQKLIKKTDTISIIQFTQKTDKKCDVLYITHEWNISKDFGISKAGNVINIDRDIKQYKLC